MTTSPETDRATGAEEVRWDLSHLFDNGEQLEPWLEETIDGCRHFESRWRGAVSGSTATELTEALSDFEALQDRLNRAYTFAYLHWVTDTQDPGRGSQLQRVRERYLEAEQLLLFFELELIHLDPDTVSERIGSEELSGFRHYLEVLRLRRDHVLSEPEEKILAETSVTGPEAWGRFFDEHLSATRFELNGDRLTQQQVLTRLYDPDREQRRTAALAFTEGLREQLKPLTFVFNTVLADKSTRDRLREYPHWLTARNLANEIPDHAVDVLIDSVTARYDLVARFYRLKARVLGLEQMQDYDRYAPLPEAEGAWEWDAAQELVLSAYGRFHPRMQEIASRFFEEHWIDAALAAGKRGGAFSHAGVPQVHPYIMLNYTGRIRDVQTLAHELGHGVHQFLARDRGSLAARPPLTTSETASVFGEMLVFEDLMAREDDPSRRLALLASKIDDTIATVFRQVAMNRFEDRIHTERREEGELSPDRFGEFWRETQEAMFQGSVQLGEHYSIWWSYIPHFIHTPGYVYAYAFGELLVLALHAVYREEGEAFADRYLELLAAGGSDWPHVLVGRLGLDLEDPEFWNRGLDAIGALIDQAEELAASV